MATCPACRQQYDAAAFCPRDGTRLVSQAESDALLAGRYRLIRKVGAGGVGEVYEGQHAYTRRRVAVKILQRNLASDREAVARLEREAQSTSGLGHPNIVDCFDFGYAEDGEVFLIMEWLAGENLDQRLQREPVDIATALEIAAQAAAGVAQAHEHGVIHRDLKPANLFLTRDHRGDLLVKVLDFGIAKLAMEHSKLTGTGVVVGTPNYMAPEQAFGEAVDGRADIYALGVILYEMVTGSVPFQADSPLAVLHQHTSRIPVPPSTRAPERDISPAVEALVMRCLAKRPADRYESMQELAHALDEVRRPDAQAAVDEEPPRRSTRRSQPDDDDPPPSRARPGRAVALAVVGAVVVTAGVIGVIVARSGGAAGAGGQMATTEPAMVDAGSLRPVVSARIDAGGDDIAKPMDAGTSPAWNHRGEGKSFHYQVVASPLPIAGQPFAFSVALTDLSHDLADAARTGALIARVSLSYYKDHVVVREVTKAVGADRQAAVTLDVARAGKYHVRLDLMSGGRVLDGARFDLRVESP